VLEVWLGGVTRSDDGYFGGAGGVVWVGEAFSGGGFGFALGGGMRECAGSLRIPSPMASFTDRYPRNTPGKYYVDGQCTDCDLCRQCAPNNIRRDDEQGCSYVYRQPETPEEIAGCEEGVFGCPTEAVGNDGDRYDWMIGVSDDWDGILANT